MRLSRSQHVSRWLVAVGASVACLAVPIAVPNSASAAPERPAASALIRIDSGGAARAQRIRHEPNTGQSTYTVSVPAGAKITWLGETRSATVAIGRFKPGRLVERWRTLGHTRQEPVLATLTWRAADGETRAALVSVSHPRRTASGKLEFTVDSSAVLPRTLKKYSVNIRRAAPQVRTYPVEGQPFNITSTVYMVAQADGPDAASGRIYSGSTTCYSYSHSLTRDQLLNFSATCGSVSFAQRSHVTITQQTNATLAADTANLKLVIDNKAMSFNQVLVEWDTVAVN